MKRNREIPFLFFNEHYYLSHIKEGHVARMKSWSNVFTFFSGEHDRNRTRSRVKYQYEDRIKVSLKEM
jgi:hypothetical protein